MINNETILKNSDYYIDLALIIAKIAHKGQKDKSGKDYINHPKTVASVSLYINKSKTNKTIKSIIALLHDTVEDTSVSSTDIRKIFGQEIANSIKLLTRKDKNEPYFDYIQRIKDSGDENAIAVKIADLLHNSDLSRLSEITQKDLQRSMKYLGALSVLTDKEFLVYENKQDIEEKRNEYCRILQVDSSSWK